MLSSLWEVPTTTTTTRRAALREGFLLPCLPFELANSGAGGNGAAGILGVSPCNLVAWSGTSLQFSPFVCQYTGWGIWSQARDLPSFGGRESAGDIWHPSAARLSRVLNLRFQPAFCLFSFSLAQRRRAALRPMESLSSVVPNLLRSAATLSTSQTPD